MHIAEIIARIEQMAPLQGAASWDASGLQVAARRTDAERLAVCLDPSPASIAAALKLGAQCILSHHPLALKPSLPKRLDHYHEVLRLLLTSDVPLYAAHTSLDVNSEGPAAWLARELHLDGLAVLEPTAPGTGDLPHGFGLAGDLAEPVSLQQLTDMLAAHIDLSTATVSGPCPAAIRRVAYCTGSGSSLLDEARAANADIFITGDVKYHTALDTQLCLFDVGHHSLEEEMMRRAAIELQHACPGLEVVFVPSASPFQPVRPRVF
ncbi:Nif3-like dinuclear metal center hexameric protein [uncultured Desulfovibrio sp.]|uniref:Nif3-like dinuclear metal center hexameric protein n=1 Tax=uncultured Desulfovibrio sp. TaxID=167968 RepID=UPI0026370CF0|nr:Nif3-like dinuclear metal center hexameric protein [uncultured Desulfovibrio sp.]